MNKLDAVISLDNQDYYIKEHGLEQVKDKLEEALK